MFVFPCPGCSEILRVRDDLAEQEGECPHCGLLLIIPTPSDAAAAMLPETGQPITLASQQISLGNQAETKFVFPCNGCGEILKAKTDMAGTPGKCPHCGKLMRIPRAGEATAATAAASTPAEVAAESAAASSAQESNGSGESPPPSRYSSTTTDPTGSQGDEHNPDIMTASVPSRSPTEPGTADTTQGSAPPLLETSRPSALTSSPPPTVAPTIVIFSCPGCGRKLKARDNLAGKEARCLQCGRLVKIPSPTEPGVATMPVTAPAKPSPPAAPLTDEQGKTIFVFPCPHCGEKLKGRDDLAGKDGKCNKCGKLFTIPKPTDAVMGSGKGSLHAAPQGPVRTPSGEADTQPEIPVRPLPDEPMAAPVPDSPSIPGYQILSELGRGSMGVVYRARQENLDRIVALKTVLVGQGTKPQMLARFEKEAMTVARLRHPNLVTAYDLGRHGGQVYFVMELLEGETVEARIEREGALDEATAWGLARQAAAGLAHAAKEGIVHRDIKPANLILVEPPAGALLPAGLPMVKITDFGLVLMAGDMANSPRITMAGTPLGTPIYMAPEQFSSSDIDLRADIYALGATVFHMLAGQPPFLGRSIWEIMTDKASQELPKLPSNVSTESMQLVANMMAKDASKRLGNYQELLLRIDELTVWEANGRPGSKWEVNLASANRPPSHSSGQFSMAPLRRRLQRRHWLTAGLGLLVLALVGFLAMLALKPGTPPAPTMRAARSQPLYKGGNLNGWTTVEGVWKKAEDEEGAAVLSGRGVARRRLPSSPNYRVTLAADLHDATAVELHFALTGAGRDDQPRYVLRVTRDGVLFGRSSSDHGPLEPASQPVPFLAADSGESPYRELRVDRQGKFWWIFFNGQQLGYLPIHEPAELAEFRLVTEGGPAYFDNLEFSGLIEAGK